MELDEKEKLEELRKIEEKKARIVRRSYLRETEEAKRRSYTSFGKLILSNEKNNPIWSLGKSNRFSKSGLNISKPYSPGPQYPPINEEIYKYKTSQKWKIGKSLRPPLNYQEKYSYYNYNYSQKDDLGALPKKWKKIIGGSINLEPKIKYDYRENSPGPGRYEPSMYLTKPRGFHYIFGEKLGSFSFGNKVSTSNMVGPSSYKVEQSKHNSKHRDYPVWSFTKDERKGLFNKTWTKNETYEEYSSLGNQVRNYKTSEPIINIGKSTREIEKHRGYFPSTMSRMPSKVYIPLPKF